MCSITFCFKRAWDFQGRKEEINVIVRSYPGEGRRKGQTSRKVGGDKVCKGP